MDRDIVVDRCRGHQQGHPGRKKVGNGTTTTVAHGEFKASNNYQFSGTFTWPAGVNSMTIKSKPVATWGNGNTCNDRQLRHGLQAGQLPKSTRRGQVGIVRQHCTGQRFGHSRCDAHERRRAVRLAGGLQGLQRRSDLRWHQLHGQLRRNARRSLSPTIADGAHFVKILVVGPPQVDKTQNFTVDCDSPASVSHQVRDLREW